jgi:hypothetical protein
MVGTDASSRGMYPECGFAIQYSPSATIMSCLFQVLYKAVLQAKLTRLA